MDPLDLGQVEAAATVPDQHRARHIEARNRLPAAGGDGARAGRENLTALEEGLHRGMVLELLEGLERHEARVLVVQADHEPDIGAVVIEVIDEAAAVRPRVERPAEAVLDESRLHASLGQLPQLLHPEAVGLWRGSRIEREAADELLGEAASRSLGDDRRPRPHFGAGGEIRAWLAALVESHVPELHAGHGAVGPHEGCGRREPRKDVDAKRFRLLREKGCEQAERDDEVAAVVQLRRQR